MDEEELPDLQEGMLDPATLDALLTDLEAHAEILDVITKGAAEQLADPYRTKLRVAVDALLTGLVRGVQVRYRYQKKEWRDTLIRVPEGVRIVRIEMPW